MAYSDENQPEISELEINETTQDEKNIVQPGEATPIETSKDNLDTSLDSEKEQDL